MDHIIPTKETVQNILVLESDLNLRWSQFQECTADHIAVVAHRRSGKSYAIYEKASSSEKDVTIFYKFNNQVQMHTDAFEDFLRDRRVSYLRTRQNVFEIGARGHSKTVKFDTPYGSHPPSAYEGEIVIFDDADDFVIDASYLAQVMIYAQVIMVSSYHSVMNTTFKRFMANSLQPSIGNHCVQPFVIPHPTITSTDQLTYDLEEERLHMEYTCMIAEARRCYSARKGVNRDGNIQRHPLTAQ